MAFRGGNGGRSRWDRRALPSRGAARAGGRGGRRRRMRPPATDAADSTRGCRCASEPSITSRRTRPLRALPPAAESAASADGRDAGRSRSSSGFGCRPRFRRRRTAGASLVLFLLSTPEGTAAASSPRRQLDRRKDSETTHFITASSTCMDRWHPSVEDPRACTNDVVFPAEWAASTAMRRYFHDTPGGCCEEFDAAKGRCILINACKRGEDRYEGAQQEVRDYLDAAKNAGGAGRGGGAAACGRTTWHMSTEVLYACTNDGIYPDVWNKPRQAKKYLFTSGRECCKKSYPNQGCHIVDTCPPPASTAITLSQRTPRPTRSPRTRRPRPSKRPAPESPARRTPGPTPEPTTTPPDWFVDYTSSQCVMDCVDEPPRPCGGRAGSWQDTFATAEECCESISWVAAEDCVATASPTKQRTEAPTREEVLQEENGDVPTPAPTVRFDWYLKAATNVCVMDCEDVPGRPCGGRATRWEALHPSIEACCASVPWKPFDECASTASPITASPTTSIPTVSPTTSVPPTATSHPTRLSDKTGAPSESPTAKPTADCSFPRPHWYLYREGMRSACINDAAYSDGVLDPSMAFYLRFDGAASCCGSPFAGGDCRVVDVCAAAASVRWYGDYSRGWDAGTCVSTDDVPVVPRGRRTYRNELECCSEGFYGQSSGACLSNAE